MIEATWLRSHLQELLRHEWEVCCVQVDADGDVPFRNGTAACWVSVVEVGDELFVRPFAHAAYGVKRSAKLLAEINDLNNRSRSALVRWCSGMIVVEQTLHSHGLTQRSLAQACHDVGSVANDIGMLMTAMFGGSTPFPAAGSRDESEDESYGA